LSEAYHRLSGGATEDISPYRFLTELFDCDYINIREGREGSWKNKFLLPDKCSYYKIPQDKNVYFGVFARDGRRGRGQEEDCTTTGTLWADYDYMTLEEVQERIRLAGIPNPSIVVNSGHGIHTYWLLIERVGSEAIPVVKAIVRATGADTRPTFKAAVMRLPGSMNVKKSPVPCKVLEANWARYALKDFEGLVTEEVLQSEGIPKLLESKMDCIKAAACGVGDGHRNFMLGRIVKDLQTRADSKAEAWNTVKAWNELNRPPEDLNKLRRDFDKYWDSPYKLLGCRLSNPKLSPILEQYCKGADCKRCGILRDLPPEFLEDVAEYNNRIIRQADRLSGNDLIVLGVLSKHSEGLCTSQLIQELTANTPCMSRGVLGGSLKKLRSMNAITTVKGNKRLGQEDLHKAILGKTYGTGLTIVTNNALTGAIGRRITPAQFRVYVALCRHAHNSQYPTLLQLGQEFGISESAVSGHLNRLEKADYIKRGYGLGDNEYKLTYRFLA